MTPLRLVLLAAAGCLTLLCLMVLVSPGAAAGPVLIDGFGHGVHRGDLPALLVWLAGVAACGWGWLRHPADASPERRLR